MSNTIKYYIKNRFMWVFYAWAMLLLTRFNGDPYVNVVVFFFGFMGVMLAISYIDEECTPNAQERLFMQKLSTIFD